jgi:thiamine-phosphate pyrophosphorylase
MASRPKHAAPRPPVRLTLVTPQLAEVKDFAAVLASALAQTDVAAVLLRLADSDERTLINRAKALATVAQEKGAALLLEGRVDLVARAGADGAHLGSIADFTAAIAQLKPDRIAGCGGLHTRHDAMVAAERDADYVMFGEPGASGERPGFEAIEERIAWWANVFEAPCVAYAAAIDEVAPLVAAGADFVALGDWLWREPAQLAALARDLRLPEGAA